MENMNLGVGTRVKHPAYGDGVIIRVHKAMYDVTFMLYGLKKVGKTYDKWEIIEAIESEDEVTFAEAEKSLLKILKAYNLIGDHVEIADKFKNGTLILKPEDDNLVEKEIPIDTFFNKIIMVRDRLRVIEQKINSNKNLDKAEKITLQQYITRSYGILTSFNVLFKEKKDTFIGVKST